MDEESQPLLNAEWISAAEAFVWLAFRGSRPGWRVSKALADYQWDYGVSWLTLSDAIANGDITHNEVRARMVKLRERRLPHEANEQRERMIDDLIRDLPKRAQEIRDGGEAIAAARDYFVAQALCGKLGVYFSNNTSAPTEAFQRAESSTFVQGMTIHTEGSITEGSIEPRDDLARQDRLDLHNRMKKRDIVSVWFKMEQVLKLRLPPQTKNDRPSRADVVDWIAAKQAPDQVPIQPPPSEEVAAEDPTVVVESPSDDPRLLAAIEFMKRIHKENYDAAPRLRPPKGEDAYRNCKTATRATVRQMDAAMKQVPQEQRRGRGDRG